MAADIEALSRLWSAFSGVLVLALGLGFAAGFWLSSAIAEVAENSARGQLERLRSEEVSQ